MHECDWLVSKIWWILSDTYPNDTCCDWVAALISLPAVIVAPMLFFHQTDIWMNSGWHVNPDWMKSEWCMDDVWMRSGCRLDDVKIMFHIYVAKTLWFMNFHSAWRWNVQTVEHLALTMEWLLHVSMMSEWCLNDVWMMSQLVWIGSESSRESKMMKKEISIYFSCDSKGNHEPQ